MTITKTFDGRLEPDHTRNLRQFVGIGDVRDTIVEFQYRNILFPSELDPLEFIDAVPRGVARDHHRAELPLCSLGRRHLILPFKLWQALEKVARDGPWWVRRCFSIA